MREASVQQWQLKEGEQRRKKGTRDLRWEGHKGIR